MPQVESPVREVILEDPRVIGVLLDARQREAFFPFVGEGTTVKRAAAHGGETPNTTLSRVRRWERLGLLRATRLERHARGVSRVYRSSADAYWVPYRYTPADSLVQLARAAYLPMLERLLRNYARVGAGLAADWGLLFQRGGSAWTITPSEAPGTRCSPVAEGQPAALLEIESLQLRADQAKSLQRELHAVLEKYRREQGEGEAYDVLIGLAPTSP